MLYIITAVHNRYDITKKFIEYLKNQTYKEYRLVLVDDGCTDNTDKMVLSLMEDAVILKGDGNLWWGGALRLAYKWIKANAKDQDTVLIMNDDTHFDDSFLQTGVQLIEENKASLITGCGFSLNTGEQIDGAVEFFPKDGTYTKNLGTATGNCASTRALIMKASSMKKIGGFHPILLPHYASDYEYTIRAARKGFVIKAFEEFNYQFDEGTTGNHNSKKATIKQIFSKRSSFNPFYRFSFIFMVTPIKYLPSHLYHQIKRYIKR